MDENRVCAFVPPYLLRRLAAADPDPEGAAARTLTSDTLIRAARESGGVRRAAGPADPADPADPAWTVHTADNTEELPGRRVRAAGDPESRDPAVDEAAYGIEASLALLDQVFGLASYDGKGAPVSLTVHYGRDYVNAFWDGTRVVFGDGDGRVFDRFTKPVDVLAHEFGHAVTEYAAGLVYRDQPGALNESVCDAFAACVRQRLLGQSAEEGDWLIGAELFLPGVAARGLRDMAAPGTAYDDPALGRDPQVGHLDDYVETDDDNGGVHVNSGIPNRAFHLAATAIGGSSAARAGLIWWTALTDEGVGPDTDFAAFARATVAAAGDDAEAVRQAWREVGVRAGLPLRVRRTGGFAGQTVEGTLDLDSDDERVAELDALMARIAPAGRVGRPLPDHFTYEFDLAGDRRTVLQQDLSPDLRRIADLVLRSGS